MAGQRDALGMDPHPHRPRRPLADAPIFPGDHLGQSAFRFFRASSYSPSLNFTSKVFAQSLRRYAAEPSFPASGFVPGSLEKRFTLESFFSLPMGFSSDAALARGFPAGALATTQDPGDFLDTPNDTHNGINYANLRLQEQGLVALLLGTPGASAGHGHGQSAIGNSANCPAC